MADIFWWVVVPYISLTVMIVGLLFRFAYRQVSWTAPSTELFEKKWLRIGSPLFHYGIVFAFIGHIMGVLIPRGVYEAMGVTDELYHFFAIAGGGVAGLMIVAGLGILLIRKLTNRRLRAQSSFADYFTVILVLVVSVLGTYMTIVYNTTVVAYEYRTTIGPWFRSLLAFQPDYQLMRDVPPLFQIHVIAAFLLFAAIPFTMLVHMFSFPARYPFRAPQQYRSRNHYKRRT
ncbi:respiratory nitrate reductase subunit gamma [Paenibacillus apiarius]|uniref:Respiratory nitrate reductase subunit gamma n=1 Tax=Paenibacillus apiarius TaxID=46240 RepID=A0ABT4E4Q0_9BACL|nr:respiratory nitrate reductase subunit gamma [Paenibacillus apiarius]MBN3526489.1 respiratory nitrate reductase subunit gamma [Paenibacillus apiarius]MCY9517061.1 respiratory nitrate reductase subunit gamma [Paenibacillus apiarius]MCY9523231.1 respiratory nitrate reductase subunit gamma [Paenibacillus apiarius]MCY9554271.1 respiratory nitrate reductase subunit gamma [Paenibacillus apiarius]MCY9560882.1 respiratory nitrate reductase subunit gamma [Paenibacillus apiarius]